MKEWRRLDSSDSGQRQEPCSCERGNELSGSIKRGECFQQVETFSFLHKESAARSDASV
jgi:hypothetical protein